MGWFYVSYFHLVKYFNFILQDFTTTSAAFTDEITYFILYAAAAC